MTKTTEKKPAAKRGRPKSTVAKKTAVKKTTAKRGRPKAAAAKKTAVKQTTAKRGRPKSAAAQKTAVKKTTAKRGRPKAAATQKPAVKQTAGKRGRPKATAASKPAVKQTAGKRGRPKAAATQKPAVKKTPAKRGRPKSTAASKPAVKKPAGKRGRPKSTTVKKAASALEKSSAIQLAIAPIGWTNDDLPELGGQIPFEQCVSEMALAGFTGSEVGNKYPKDPAILNKALKLRGLTICNAWFSSFLTTKPYEEVEADFIKHRDFLYAVGARVIGAAEQGHSIQGQDKPIFDAKPVFSADEWKLLTEGLNKLGKRAAEKGMKLTYHHHMGTGVQTAAEIDRLMENTDPKLLGLLYDTGHLVFSGEDHLAVLEKWMSRIRHVHLKDMRPAIRKQAAAEKWPFLKAVKAGVFTVPGDGCIDFVPVFRALQKAKYSGWWVVEAEQDPAKANPLEYAIKARSYIWEKADI